MSKNNIELPGHDLSDLDPEQDYFTLRQASLDLLNSLNVTKHVQEESAELRQRVLRIPEQELGTLARLSSQVSLLAEQALEIERNGYTGCLSKLQQGMSEQQQHMARCREETAEQSSSIASSSQILDEKIEEVSRLVDERTDASFSRVITPALAQLGDQFQNMSGTVIEGLQTLQQSFATLEEKLAAIETEAAMYRRRAEHFSKLSRIDPLTQLANRNGFDDQASHELQRWRRYGTPLSLAIIDLDLFKSVNDRFGHLVGDQVLRAVALQLGKSLRDSDFVSRFGGEEFVVLLTHTDQSTAQMVMNRVRETIAALPFRFKEESFQVTISVGISQLKGDEDVETLLHDADCALYRAKNEGRNRCYASLAQDAA